MSHSGLVCCAILVFELRGLGVSHLIRIAHLLALMLLIKVDKPLQRAPHDLLTLVFLDFHDCIPHIAERP